MSEEYRYLTSTDVADLLKVNIKAARKIVKDLNAELARKGYMTVPRKVPEKYLMERFYG